jgi:hypothetical protein
MTKLLLLLLGTLLQNQPKYSGTLGFGGELSIYSIFLTLSLPVYNQFLRGRGTKKKQKT